MSGEPGVCATLAAACLDYARVARTLPPTGPAVFALEREARGVTPCREPRGPQLLRVALAQAPHALPRSGGRYGDNGAIANSDAGNLERKKHPPAGVPIGHLRRAVIGGASQPQIRVEDPDAE